MTPDGIWNLLMLSITSLTISVSVLLWFLTDYLNLLQKADADNSLEEEKALLTSTRVTAIVTGSVLIFVIGCLSGIVTWSHMVELGISLWTQEFYLLSFSTLLPIIGALLAGLLMFEKADIGGAFERLWTQFLAKPLNLEDKLQNLQVTNLSYNPLSPSNRTKQEWNEALKWVEKHQYKWGLGKGFIRYKKNPQILISLVAKQWAILQPKDEQCEQKAKADEIPQLIAPLLVEVFLKYGYIKAVNRDRPLLVAKAACALYEREAHKKKDT